MTHEQQKLGETVMRKASRSKKVRKEKEPYANEEHEENLLREEEHRKISIGLASSIQRRAARKNTRCVE